MSDDEYACYYDPEIEEVPNTPLGAGQAESQPETLPALFEVDEYDAYDFSEFTGEELAGLEALAATPGTCAALGDDSRGGPRLEIALEGTSNSIHFIKAPRGQDVSFKQWLKPSRSPYQLFRRGKGRLSVTDVTGLAWCEVQFDYGLRQGRSRKLAERPKEFVTAQGKTIAVDQKAAVINDRIVKKGQAVHKTLEREIRPEEVEVDIATLEEEWALKLVKMIACMQDLMTGGCCREMPVFGLIQGQMISGIIDELVRIPAPELVEAPHEDTSAEISPRSLGKRGSPSTPSKVKSKRSRTSPPSSQSQITSFFQATDNGSSSPQTPPPKAATLPDSSPLHRPQRIYPFTLHLSDTKTRRTATLPSDEDTLTSRLQLMLYHRLLSNVMADPKSRSETIMPLDFDAFWLRAGVDPSRSFSGQFMTQASLMFASEEHVALNSLNALVTAWRHHIDALGVEGVDHTLTLRYRAQPGHRRRSRDTRAFEGGSILSAEERQAAAQATQASFNTPPGTFGGLDNGLAQALGGSLEGPAWAGYSLESEDMQLQWALQASLKTAERNTITTKDDLSVAADEDTEALAGPASEAIRDETGILSGSPNADAITPPLEDDSSGGDIGQRVMSMEELDLEAQILGVKEFPVDNKMLDQHLISALEYWHGDRAPRGVDITKTKRCMTCEYREGCEWREQKAEELEELRNRAAH
ncbi:hypothetical protein CERSUDRAFT_90860 [Gelatoporia subvermispora B]|uniref:Exonuclease V n=1 Tax=Ceriporiopsis subvermispora (strain B) TaxID=914234 RepID=M2RTH6_CERS8|nr:hypothetical protein CERSUDRAFT_90860 [Gelatoporia subvermispora B]